MWKGIWMTENLRIDKPTSIWNPLHIALLSIFISFLPAGILYAMNYGRLGFVQKKKNSILFVVITFLIYVLIEYYFASTKVFIVANAAFAVIYYREQKKLYSEHIKNGGQKASIWFPLFLSLLAVLVYVGIIFGTAYYTTIKYNNNLQVALEYERNGHYENAITLYQELIEKDPEEFAAYNNLVLVFEKSGQYDLAKKMAIKYLEINPNFEAAKELLNNIEFNEKWVQAISEHEAGNYQEAEKIYKQLIAEGHNEPTVNFNLGAVYDITEQYELAKEQLEIVLLRDENFADADEMLEKVIAKIDITDTFNHYAKSITDEDIEKMIDLWHFYSPMYHEVTKDFNELYDEYNLEVEVDQIYFDYVAYFTKVATVTVIFNIKNLDDTTEGNEYKTQFIFNLKQDKDLRWKIINIHNE
jgi:tetratricopeptide (TPR) repeat protein